MRDMIFGLKTIFQFELNSLVTWVHNEHWLDGSTYGPAFPHRLLKAAQPHCLLPIKVINL